MVDGPSTGVAPTEALAVLASSPLPVFGGKEMTDAFTAYRDLQRALDQAMPDQIMEIKGEGEGKKFRKKGYWRAVAVAFNLTVEPVDERREIGALFDDNRENFGWIVTYRATAPNGRSATGDGSCFAVEKARRFKCPHPHPDKAGWTVHFPPEACPDYTPTFQWKALPAQATEHNIRSHAHTRAFNRAVSNLVGFGEVSAEEVEHDDAKTVTATRVDSAGAPSQTTTATVPQRQDGSALILEVKKGTNPKSPTYVKCDDGRVGSTFDDKLIEMATKARDAKTPVIPTFETKGKYTNLTALAVPVDVGPPLPFDATVPLKIEGPVGEPETVMTVRAVASTPPYWVVQTNVRQYRTYHEAVAKDLFANYQKRKVQAIITFATVASDKGPQHAYFDITEYGEATAILAQRAAEAAKTAETLTSEIPSVAEEEALAGKAE